MKSMAEVHTTTVQIRLSKAVEQGHVLIPCLRAEGRSWEGSKHLCVKQLNDFVSMRAGPFVHTAKTLQFKFCQAVFASVVWWWRRRSPCAVRMCVFRS